MAKNKKKVEINRSKYNQIRKMDHHTMEQCITGYYDQGYAAGFEAGQQAAMPSFNTVKAIGSILRIKGIGKSRLEAIHKALVAAGAQDIGEQLDEMEASMKQMAAGGQNA